MVNGLSVPTAIMLYFSSTSGNVVAEKNRRRNAHEPNHCRCSDRCVYYSVTPLVDNMSQTPIADSLKDHGSKYYNHPRYDAKLIKAIERLELENAELKDRIKFLERLATNFSERLVPEMPFTDGYDPSTNKVQGCVCGAFRSGQLLGGWECPVHGKCW